MKRMKLTMKKKKRRRKDWMEFLHLPSQQWLCSQEEGDKKLDAALVWIPLRRPRRRPPSLDLEPWS